MDRIKRNNTLLFVIKLLLASRYKSLLLYLPIIFITSVFTFSIDDQEAITLYINKLQEFSDHKISKDQKLWIQNFYLNNTNRDPVKLERERARHEFNTKKKHLKQQWEAHCKIKWPQVKITKKSKTNAESSTNAARIITPATLFDYEAHHTVPLNAGGINYFWNISPLTSRNHHLLHDSFEEKACFSHDLLHKKFIRFVLKLQTVFLENCGSYINKKGANYAT